MSPVRRGAAADGQPAQAVQRAHLGAATEGIDAEAARGVVTFEPWQESAKVTITITTTARRRTMRRFW